MLNNIHSQTSNLEEAKNDLERHKFLTMDGVGWGNAVCMHALPPPMEILKVVITEMAFPTFEGIIYMRTTS